LIFDIIERLAVYVSQLLKKWPT